MKLNSRYGYYFPEYANYFGRPFIMAKSMYGMTNSVNLYANKIINCLIDEAGFKQEIFQMSIYYIYAPDGSKLVVLSCFYYYIYWFTYEELVKRF